MPNVAVTILAAGNSSRLGQAKQLRMFAGKTLLEHAVNAGCNSRCSNLVLVLGADFEEIKRSIEPKALELIKECAQLKEFELIRNEDWQQGMGTSISTAIRHLERKQIVADAAIIMTCDQPHVSSELIDSLIELHEQTQMKIVATAYSGIKGVPALFVREMFSSLRELNGSTGARKLIEQYQGQNALAVIDFPQGEIDIDTESDWEAFMAQLNTTRA